jgi:hypothetical protein
LNKFETGRGKSVREAGFHLVEVIKRSVLSMVGIKVLPEIAAAKAVEEKGDIVD